MQSACSHSNQTFRKLSCFKLTQLTYFSTFKKSLNSLREESKVGLADFSLQLVYMIFNLEYIEVLGSQNFGECKTLVSEYQQSNTYMREQLRFWKETFSDKNPHCNRSTDIEYNNPQLTPAGWTTTLNVFPVYIHKPWYRWELSCLFTNRAYS